MEERGGGREMQSLSTPPLLPILNLISSRSFQLNSTLFPAHRPSPIASTVRTPYTWIHERPPISREVVRGGEAKKGNLATVQGEGGWKGEQIGWWQGREEQRERDASPPLGILKTIIFLISLARFYSLIPPIFPLLPTTYDRRSTRGTL